MFFRDWSSLLRIVLVGIPAYLALVLLLRTGGKRTLSKFNAFDLVITVAFGSTLATGILSDRIALAEIIVAFALLVLLQFCVTWSAMRWHVAHAVFKSEPKLLYHSGEYLERAMRRERVPREALLAAVRSHGHSGMEHVQAIVLETDGSLSVVTRSGADDAALRGVERE